jgi:hypothetical protein
MTLTGRKCASGSTELLAVYPGHEPNHHDLLGLLERGQPAQWFCLNCWMGKFGPVGEDRGNGG